MTTLTALRKTIRSMTTEQVGQIIHETQKDIDALLGRDEEGQYTKDYEALCLLRRELHAERQRRDEDAHNGAADGPYGRIR